MVGSEQGALFVFLVLFLAMASIFSFFVSFSVLKYEILSEAANLATSLIVIAFTRVVIVNLVFRNWSTLAGAVAVAVVVEVVFGCP